MILALMAACGTPDAPPQATTPAVPERERAQPIRAIIGSETLSITVDGQPQTLDTDELITASASVFPPRIGSTERWVAWWIRDARGTRVELVVPGPQGPGTLFHQTLALPAGSPTGQAFGQVRTTVFVRLREVDGDGQIEVVSLRQESSDVGVRETYTVLGWDGTALVERPGLGEAARDTPSYADQQMEVLASAVGLWEVHLRASTPLYATETHADQARQHLGGSLEVELPLQAHLVTLPEGPQARLVVTERRADGHRSVVQNPLGEIDIERDPACPEAVPLFALRTTEWSGNPEHRALVVQHLRSEEIIARVAHWDGASLTVLPAQHRLGRCDGAIGTLEVEPFTEGPPDIRVVQALRPRRASGHTP